MAKRVMAMNGHINPMLTLVVDDSEDECVLLNVGLRSVNSVKLIGFVHDGIEAIYYLRGVERFGNRETFPYPDLLLLDFSMPRCNGLQVLRFLWRQFLRPRVILWSNTLDRVNVPLALQLGADMVCKKPADKYELAEIIRRLEDKVFGAAAFPHQEKKPAGLCRSSGS
jgi:CheY-like chemotaxis protein